MPGEHTFRKRLFEGFDRIALPQLTERRRVCLRAFTSSAERVTGAAVFLQQPSSAREVIRACRPGQENENGKYAQAAGRSRSSCCDAGWPEACRKAFAALITSSMRIAKCS